MFGKLFGSMHMGAILTFLFINGRGYPSQIAKRLKLPLTPVQKAFQKIEKEGLVSSEYEGKNRLYFPNPAHPLSREFEALIRKAFSLLPVSEKKKYFSPTLSAKNEKKMPLDTQAVLSQVWSKLQQIKSVLYFAGDREGTGKVTIECESPYSTIFDEQGTWNGGMKFHNIFRWKIDPQRELLSLEHLRLGKNHPVFLFYLVPISKDLLESIDTHLHGKETYYGFIEQKSHGLKFQCRILTPHKNEENTYFYS